MKPNSKVKRKFSKPVKVKFYDGKHIDLLGKPNSPKPSPETISEIKKKYAEFKDWLSENCWSEEQYGAGKYDKKIFNYFLPYLTAGTRRKSE
jgi:hypothetical protein